MKKLFLTSLSLLTLVGAGCVGSASYDKTTGEDKRDVTGNVEISTYVALDCNDGLTLYQSKAHNVEFCYPEKSGDGVVTVADDNDGVVLSVNGDAVRKVWVVDVNPSTPREDIVEVYAIDGLTDVVCGVMGLSDEVDGRHAYVLVGENKAGEQGLDTATACTYQESDEKDGFDMNEQRAGTFYMYDRTPGTLLILTGEQDPSLGELSGEFTASLQPKK